MTRKTQTIQTAHQALAYLDYQAAFTKGDTSNRCVELANVIRDLLGQQNGDADAEWLYLGSPTDVVQALLQRAWDDDVSDEDRVLIERGATALQESLDRNVKLASVIERSEMGL